MSVVQEQETSLEINPLKVYEAYVNDYETKTGNLIHLIILI
jgi:hypothetical protein